MIPTTVRVYEQRLSATGLPLEHTSHPVEDGRVVDWDQVEAMLHHVLYNKFNWRPLEETNVLWVDLPGSRAADRETLAQVRVVLLYCCRCCSYWWWW